MKRFLTIDVLDEYLSNRKKSFSYNFENEDGYGIAVQIPGIMTFSESDYDPTTGLLPVHLQSCHIDSNRNGSRIKEEIMELCKLSIYNRPIMGYIHKLSDGTYDFAGHEMFINEDNEIEYEEIPVGIIPESCNPQLIYDEEKDKTYLDVDGYVFEDYTRAPEILKEKKKCKVSVELVLQDFSYSAKDKVMDIEKFYFQGVTILGKTRDTEIPIEEGMYGSNIKLKDFSEKNNSLFSNDVNDKLVETLNRLNNILSNFNINNNFVEELRKEVNSDMDNIELENVDTLEVQSEELTEVEETTEVEEVVETEIEAEAEEVETNSEEDNLLETDAEKKPVDDALTEEDDEEDEEDDIEGQSEDDESSDVSDTESLKEQVFSRTFEISHNDIKNALYRLLIPYEEINNDYYWIIDVYDNHFVYQGCNGAFHAMKYTKDNDNVTLDGSPYDVYAEFLTSEERVALDEMRSNYSSIKTELNAYHQRDEINDKKTIFNDYLDYIETKEFQSLMTDEIILSMSKEELIEKADAIVGKFSRLNKLNIFEKKEPLNNKIVGFAKKDTNCSFLDGLLKK